tara:strand:- start:194 stop:391 length:198 start_codon:yes stop_codon:yes gene_type:complete
MVDIRDDLTNDVDHSEGLPSSETSAGKDPRSLNVREPNLHVHDRTVVLVALNCFGRTDPSRQPRG